MFTSLKLKIFLAGRFLGQTDSGGRFAPAVALAATLGITIGIAALIVVTSVMSGLEARLKEVVLGSTPHLIIKADTDIVKKLEQLDNIVALCPMVEARALAQSRFGVVPVTLEGNDLDNAVFLKPPKDDKPLITTPEKGTFNLLLSVPAMQDLNLYTGDRVRIISTVNARYTMMGLTPSTRLFGVSDYLIQAPTAAENRARGSYEDVRRVLRAQEPQLWLRLFLSDPYKLDEITALLDKENISYHTWQEKEGEFFSAVGMEKTAMGVMLFLIVMVASFNLLSSLTMMVSSHLEEIAILKTLGMHSRDIVEIFFIMGLLCSIAGVASGTALGIILSSWANELMAFLNLVPPSSSKIPVVISFQSTAAIALISCALALICTVFPALKAGHADAVQNLEHK